MPFCIHCGTQVGAADAFCGRCGTAQPGAPARPEPRPDPLAAVSPRTASVLCYIPVIGWIASIVVLASDRFRTLRPVRFHAFQGLYLGVAWIMNDWVIKRMLWFDGMHHLPALLNLLLLAAAIFMITKASRDEMYSLPVFGELAQRSMTEE
jgi:uncharacterized membrane protein